MGGSLVEAFGPAALRFLRPIRVVGGGGCSYLGFSYTHEDGKSRSETHDTG